ncbi:MULTISPECIES: hypothetical protein [Bacteroides]|uniref:hypothetical protein n=1 Tax=Bacteroides TaxID=816 RepID=UPI00265B2078|nr:MULTISPECIES: hypothetical protein [Bacteroides]
MKKLLVLLTMFAFATVMAASSSTTCSGRLIDQNSRYVSKATIHCVETDHSVTTDSRGNFSALQVEPNSVNTLEFTSSTGAYLGSQEIDVQSSSITSITLQTGNMSSWSK